MGNRGRPTAYAAQDRLLLLQVVLLFGLRNLNLLIDEAEQVSFFLGQADLAFVAIWHVDVDIDVDQIQIAARLHWNSWELPDGGQTWRKHILLSLRIHDLLCVLTD